jgi:hypothetical protein
MPKRSIAVLGALITMVLATGVVLASHQFPDVPNSNIFHDSIAWLNDNNITQVEEGNNWKPKDPVTREQMAAFLHRYDDNLGSAETSVTALSGPFGITNGTVSLTPDGVEFGPYANGGAAGGSVCYSGMNGDTLSDVENLAYYIRYVSDGDTGGVGVPYLRVFTDNGSDPDHSSIFSPNTQAPDPDVAEGPFHEWVATSGSWRYDDDAGNGPDMPYADLIADHGTETITNICVTTGNTAGTDLAALLRWLEINGERFVFRG